MKAMIGCAVVLAAVFILGQARPDGPAKAGESPGKADGRMGQMVIVAYRPRAEKDAALLDLVRRHHPRLKAEGLVTDRPAYAMRAKDGTIVEVFEWKSQKAVDEAHTNPAVQTMWKEFGEACDYVPLSQLAEAKEMFAGFAPVELPR